MLIRKKFVLIQWVCAIILFCVAVPAYSSSQIIDYSFFARMTGKGNAFATGTLTYDTYLQTFIEGDIYTSDSYQFGGLVYPGRHYNQVNLVTNPGTWGNGNPLLSIWEAGAYGSLYEHTMSISLAPSGGSYQRLVVFFGTEGPCGFFNRLDQCLIRQDRTFLLGGGNAVAFNTQELAEPSVLGLFTIGLLSLGLWYQRNTSRTVRAQT